MPARITSVRPKAGERGIGFSINGSAERHTMWIGGDGPSTIWYWVSLPMLKSPVCRPT